MSDNSRVWKNIWKGLPRFRHVLYTLSQRGHRGRVECQIILFWWMMIPVPGSNRQNTTYQHPLYILYHYFNIIFTCMNALFQLLLLSLYVFSLRKYVNKIIPSKIISVFWCTFYMYNILISNIPVKQSKAEETTTKSKINHARSLTIRPASSAMEKKQKENCRKHQHVEWRCSLGLQYVSYKGLLTSVFTNPSSFVSSKKAVWNEMRIQDKR